MRGIFKKGDRKKKLYLALGDSMSIDYYTGVRGGGAVNQFHRYLGQTWRLIDKTFDGATIPEVFGTVKKNADLVTLTIGGNDLIIHQNQYLTNGLKSFAEEHLRLLQYIRERNRRSLFLIGDVYAPEFPLTERQSLALDEANRIIRKNVQEVGGRLVKIFEAFKGREKEFLCLEIEPTLEGATAIAKLFQSAFEAGYSSP